MRYLLVLLLGFMLHKGVEEVYDYYWEKGFAACGDQYAIDIRNKVDAPLTKRFNCTYEHMGVVSKFAYVLGRPHFARSVFEKDKGYWYY